MSFCDKKTRLLLFASWKSGHSNDGIKMCLSRASGTRMFTLENSGAQAPPWNFMQRFPKNVLDTFAKAILLDYYFNEINKNEKKVSFARG